MKINFSDFWTGFNTSDNFFISILKKHSINYSITNCIDEADVVFFSLFGQNHLKAKGLKIFYSGESVILPEFMFDYCISMNPSSQRNFFYMPHWVVWDNPNKILTPKISFQTFKKKKDCCIIIGNPNAQDRIDFYNKLSKFIKVDSGGSFMNNVGKVFLLPQKHDFISEYKFIICFENIQQKGYCTEKLFEAMHCNVIPIYFGDPDVGKYFNQESFINILSSNDFDWNAEKVYELLKDDSKLEELWNKSWINESNYQELLSGDKFEKFVIDALMSAKKSSNRLRWILTSIYYKNENIKFKIKQWFIS